MRLAWILILVFQTPTTKPPHITLRNMNAWVCVANGSGESCKSAGDVARYLTQNAPDECGP